MRRVSRHDIRGPVRDLLAPHRQTALGQTLAEYQETAAALHPAVMAHDVAATERFDSIVAEAVAAMRSKHPGTNSSDSQIDKLLGFIDAPLYRDRPELMDDPAFPEDERTDSIEVLDRFNRCTGIYATVAEVMAPLVQRAEQSGRRPIVHDLAAGHGGLALYLAEQFGGRMTIEASDLREEYLEIGRAHARRKSLDVMFLVQDALDLSALAQRGVDVILCTQALHHFPPGMIARVMGEAARAARVGVCFVDGERSWTTLGLVGLVGALYGRTYAFYHDAVTSIRRMYYEEELSLIAQLAPGMPEARVETGIVAPSHVYVRMTRPSEKT